MTLLLILLLVLLLIYIKNNINENFDIFIDNLQKNDDINMNSRIAIVSLVKNPIDFPLWLKYYRKLGIKKFYIRLEDSPSWEEYIKNNKIIDDIELEIGNSSDSNNYTTLIERQKEFVNKIITKINNNNVDNINWLLHLDSDEILYGDIKIFDEIPNNKYVVKIQNAEALYDDKNNYTCFSSRNFLKCSEGAPCKSYINGKSGGKIGTNGLYLDGPHLFGIIGATNNDYILNIPFDKLCVLHFESCTFGQWAEKFYHLSKNDKQDNPFEYYKLSTNVNQKSYDVYKKNKMQLINNFNKEHIFSLDK